MGHSIISGSTQVEVSFISKKWNGAKYSEVLISPIERENWHDLWRVTVTCIDAPGVAHLLYQSLAEIGVRVVTAETSISHGQLHIVELLVDAKRYSGMPNDGDHEKRLRAELSEMETLVDLEGYLKAHLLSNLAVNESSGRVKLRIRRVKELLSESNDLSKSAKHDIPLVTPVNVPRHDTSPEIRLPEKLRTRLITELNIKRYSQPYYVCIGDTKERCIRVLFFQNTDNLIQVQFRTTYRIGTLALITQAISKANLNIITSSRRTEVYDCTGLAEFLLESTETTAQRDSTSGKICANTRRRLIDALESLPQKKKLIRDLRFFDFEYSNFPDWESNPNHESRVEVDTEDQYEIVHPTRIANIFAEQYAEISRRTRNTRISKRDESLLQTALEGERVQELLSCPFRIFISHSLDADQVTWLSHVEKEFQDLRFFLIPSNSHTASSDVPQETNIRLVVSTIKDNLCNGMIGIWSCEKNKGAQTISGQNWPSPWLHFELGVSDAYGIPHELVIQECLDPYSWKKIEGDRPHRLYKKPEDLWPAFADALSKLLLRLGRKKGALEILAKLMSLKHPALS